MSDPSAINLPIHTAITSDMQYGLKPSAPKSRSYRINVSPLNKAVFVGQDQMIFELPTGRKNTYFDQSQSYLKFSVQVQTTTACGVSGSGVYLDNSAYSFIQRLDIYNSSNLLETINEYGQLCNLILDTSLTQSDKAGLSTLMGFNPNSNIVYGSATASIGGSCPITQTPGDRSGMSLAGTTAISGSIPYTFTLPLLSGVVGVNSSKCLPVGALNSPIRMEMYLSSNDDAVYYGTAGVGCVWQIVNVEFCACYIELYEDVMTEQFHQGIPQFISTSTYRQASTYIPSATAGEFTTLLPFRCASLNGLYARFRNLATAVQGVNASASYRKGSSINPNLSSFYFRIGSSIYPNKPIYLINGSLVGTGAEGYAELLKSFHSLSQSIGNSAITSNNYNVCATATQGWSLAYVPGAKTGTTIDTHGNAMAVAIECQSMANRNDTILSGISTLNSQIFFTGIINSGVNAGGTNSYNYTADFFANMDMILVIENGIMSAKF